MSGFKSRPDLYTDGLVENFWPRGQKEKKMINSFYDVLGFSPSTTSKELDHIALERAGVLWTGRGGYGCPKPTPKIPQAPEWGTKVIARQGMGNCGRIVLVGKTSRTRELLRRGKAQSLVNQGVPAEVAAVAISMPYGMESEVALLAAELVEVTSSKGPFWGDSHRAFALWTGNKNMGAALSFPRKRAAAEIAAKVKNN